MKKQETERRSFIKLTAAGLSNLVIPGVSGSNKDSIRLSKIEHIERKMQIVCIGAHPGDPEFGCGGTMAKYSDAGHAVTFLYLTRGEASDSTKTHEEMANLRSLEASDSCKILNATPVFAGQLDGNTELNKTQNEKMTKIIFDLKPDIVFAQWPVDAHPDHQVKGLLSLTSWVKSNRRFHLYFYEVNTGSETMSFTPTDYVDITAVRERKKLAMFAHKTQNPIETYNDYFKPLEEFRGLEAGVKVAEGFIHFKASGERSSLIGL